MLRRVHGIVKYHDVAAGDLAVGQHMVPRSANPITEFIDQQVVADQERVLHGLGRNRESLDQEGNDEHSDDYSSSDGLNGRRPVTGREIFAPRHN